MSEDTLVENTMPSQTSLEALFQMQNEVSYVIECLSEDFRAEGIRGLHDAYDYLEKCPLPMAWCEQIKRHLDEAVAPLNGRDLVTASRILYGLRRRLANEIAALMDRKLPYALVYYPLLSSGQEVGEVGFKRMPEG
jgi:hypothetical protein